MAKKISGIHNYCDRWCERCSFTAQCAIYENEQGMSDEEKDISNQAFWERLSDNFAKAMVMLREKARDLGIDLDELAKETEKEKSEREKKDKANREHPLMLMSLEYGDLSRNWRKQPAISQKADQIVQQFELGLISSKNALAEAERIKDCLSVITWYETFISAKMMRAISGKADDNGWAKENGFPNDYDGTAKIILIGIDRSMQAWTALYERIPEEEDHILSMLAMLEKMKKLILQEFPEAMAFKRPGFDE